MSATKRGSDRSPQDFYATPDYAINSILEKIKLPVVSTCCEPCRGSGAIYDKLPDEKYKEDV